MTKNEAYNALLERVQRAGGYIKFGEDERPVIKNEHIIVAALFESADDSSPLKLIDSRFIAFDVDDYFDGYDIEFLLNILN